MLEALKKIRQDALERLATAESESDLAALQQEIFGKSGQLTAILRTM